MSAGSRVIAVSTGAKTNFTFARLLGSSPCAMPANQFHGTSNDTDCPYRQGWNPPQFRRVIVSKSTPDWQQIIVLAWFSFCLMG